MSPKIKMPKMPKMDKLLNDKNVLYVVFIVAILNVLGYLITNNLEAVVFFLIVGFLTTYFSKNMIVVLITSIVSTSIFASTRTNQLEGMSSNRNNSESEDKQKELKKELKKEKLEKEHEMKKEKLEKEHEMKKELNDEDEEIEEMTSISNKKGNRIDYANTLEKAYENLQSTIGKEGIKGLTDQTSNLLNQQKELMDNINSMQPFLKTAESFMNKLDFSGLENIGSMLSKVTGKKE
jgi:uncharacterized membrane protein (DUF106 family)